MSLRTLSQALHTKQVSSTELTRYFLARIEKEKTLNAFISLNEESAIQAALHADDLLAKGQARALTGIPMAHKDVFCTQTMPTTCGSKMLEHFYSPYSAFVVERFEKEASVLLGKTNMDEFGMGSSNENSYFGAVKNPWNLAHVPGGSSGGSAAAVAAKLVPFATGSDTGGSVRQPAAFCGISGIKPTYGLISRFGMVAYASSLDQAGAFAPSAEDLALILEVMVGHDKNDSTSINKPIPSYSNDLDKPLPPLKIGLPTCFFHPDIDEDVQKAIRDAVHFFEQQGATIVELDLQLTDLWAPCYYVIACAEASSNLARYDGIRYGYKALNTQSVHELICRSRTEGFGQEVKRRILAGTHVLSSDCFDAYYVQAQKVRRLIQNELQNHLSQVDIILGPTTPSCAYKLGEKLTCPTQRYLADIFTVAANLAGLPGISIPVGFNSASLPIGMQLMGSHFSESLLLRIAHFYQQHTDWHQKSVPTTDDIL